MLHSFPIITCSVTLAGRVNDAAVVNMGSQHFVANQNVLYFPNDCHKIYIFTLKHFSTHKTWITRFNPCNFLKDNDQAYLNGEIASSLELCIVDCRIHRILIFYAISLFSSITLFRTKNNEMISLTITFYIIHLFAIKQ